MKKRNKATLKQRRQMNLEVYTSLASRDKSTYGDNFNGKYALLDIIESGSEFVVDIGCGGNQFINEIRKAGIQGTGIDISNKGADIIAPAHLTTLENNIATHITSFDCMEHLEPDEISEVLLE